MRDAAAAGRERFAADSAASTLTARVAAVALIAAAGLGLKAALDLRPLFADGFYYLLNILAGEWTSAPARITIELLRQWPLLAADALGLDDLATLAVIFGASVQLAPLVIVALAWLPLPAGRKFLFALPLLHVAAGTMASAFVPITEGATAAAYFWLLLFCVLFNAPRGGGAAVMGVLAAGSVLLHEGMAFLGPVLALAALSRSRREPEPRSRAAFRALAAWFMAVSALQAYFVAVPWHPANRGAFFEALLRFEWAHGFDGHVNLPALLGLAGVAAVAAIAALQFLPERWRLWPLGWALVGALAVVSAREIENAVAGGEMLAASAQFAARNHALLLSLPLGLAAVALARRPAAVRFAALAQTLAVCGVLMAGAIVWQAEALRPWNDYVQVFRRVLDGDRGFVAWDGAMAKLHHHAQRTMRAMSHDWVEPSLSIVLSPRGDVRAILGPSNPRSWQAFDATDPAALPRHRAWRYDSYLDALARQKAKGELRP